MKPIIDKCPKCKTSFVYDTDLDDYVECNKTYPDGTDGIKLILYLCPHDGMVVAIQVNSDIGSDVYVPSTQEI